MTDTIDNTLAAMIRSMEKVVVPAVDQAHPLATEQADLILESLRLIREQLPDRQTKALRELDRYVLMAEDVAGLIGWSPDIGRQFDTALRDAHRLRELAHVEHCAVNDCVTALAGLVSRAVREARTKEVASRSDLERAVLSGSIPIVDDDVAWFAPQGWYSTPSA